jgi:hypothetical protein
MKADADKGLSVHSKGLLLNNGWMDDWGGSGHGVCAGLDWTRLGRQGQEDE